MNKSKTGRIGSQFVAWD